jgi:hypothetical protein
MPRDLISWGAAVGRDQGRAYREVCQSHYPVLAGTPQVCQCHCFFFRDVSHWSDYSFSPIAERSGAWDWHCASYYFQ